MLGHEQKLLNFFKTGNIFAETLLVLPTTSNILDDMSLCTFFLKQSEIYAQSRFFAKILPPWHTSIQLTPGRSINDSSHYAELPQIHRQPWNRFESFQETYTWATQNPCDPSS